MLKRYSWLFILGCLLTTPAYAYLDGGTGSVLVQGLLAGIAGFLTVLRLYWQKVKQFTRKLMGKPEPVSSTPSKQNKED